MARIVPIGDNVSPLNRPFTRAAAQPIDASEVFYSYAELQAYATKKLGGTAYVGQVCAVVDEVNGTSRVYVIVNTNGDLVELSRASGSQTKLVFDSIYSFPKVGDGDVIYVVTNGPSYTWNGNKLRYELLNPSRAQFMNYVKEGDEIVGAERELDGGDSSADYAVSDFHFKPEV